jgi:hypothetical protein
MISAECYLPSRSNDSDPEAGDTSAVPGYKNYLIYCDESGMDGSVYYGFGSLWMPWERRGDFAHLITETRASHRYTDEIKWTHVGRSSEAFYTNLIDAFFVRNWLMFHALIIRKGYSDRTFHKDFDEEKTKRLVMLIRKKIAFFCAGDPSKRYHVRVDPLPVRYKKTDEVAFKIAGAMLKKDLGNTPLETLFTRHSHETPGIQMVDFLLGAALAGWQNKATADHKLRVRRHLAKHLGWPDMDSDTRPSLWKFNIWYFHDPTDERPREVSTRAVNYKLPIRPYIPRRATSGSGTFSD